MTRQIKIVVEKHSDGYVAYPLGGLKGVRSAINFHIETFGSEVLPDESPLLEAFIAETTVPA